MTCNSDIERFNQLFNEYHERFIRFALGYVRERQTAEDIVSESFGLYWKNRKKVLSNTKPQAYILTIIKNKCLNYLQHLRVRLEAEQKLSEHSAWELSSRISNLTICDPHFLFSEEIQQIIQNTLKQLSPKTCLIFMMSRHKGLSNKEIAKRMHISVKTVEFHISKTLVQLRISLKDFICLFYLLSYFY